MLTHIAKIMDVLVVERIIKIGSATYIIIRSTQSKLLKSCDERLLQMYGLMWMDMTW